MEKRQFLYENDSTIKTVLQGRKTLDIYLYDGKNKPTIGKKYILCFDNEKQAGIIETTDYSIIKFREITEDMSNANGDGMKDFAIWQTIYRYLFNMKNHKFTDKDFNDDTLVVIEYFKVCENFVEERLKIGKKIALANPDILGELKDIYEVNVGFRNTIFEVNDKYIIKVCTNEKLESTFQTEYNFYKNNSNNKFIPKFYKYNDTKKDIPYIYEIIEKLSGKTLYNEWYLMSESRREETISKLISIIKELHSKKYKKNDFVDKLITDIKSRIQENKDLFKDHYKSIIECINNLSKYFNNDNSYALIHNDIHFDNIIYSLNNDEIKIIDFNDAIIAPIDFEFMRLYMCMNEPWRWANTDTDDYQKTDDYKHIWEYIKKYYPELNKIEYLEKRMIIYTIWYDTKHLSEYHPQELIDKLITRFNKIEN